MPEWLRGSVFAKLVTAMLSMAICLVLLVTLFFGFLVGPNLNSLIFRLAREYSRVVSQSSPDLDAARRLAARLEVNVRYDGPSGSWATSPDVPSVDSVRGGRIHEGHLLVTPRYYIEPAPQGGSYLFAWDFGQRIRVAHDVLLLLLVVMIVGIVFTTHAVIRRVLAPLRGLNEGVARVAEGQLDIELPEEAPDEFGRLTKAFNAMVARVRSMIRDRDQLLVDVSHELRSPLTRMKVALELAPNDAQRAQLASDVTEMERMVTELLEFERLRSGRGMHVAAEDLVAIVHDVADEFRGRQPGVRVVVPSRELIADVDGDKVRMVLRNLLDNAFKYSLPDSRPVEVSASNGRNAVVIRVTDDGVGILDGDAERVFEPFFRVDASRSKETGGYGLGLSICKRVMEAHGGSIVVERSRDRGASFALTFPAGNRNQPVRP